MISTLRSLASSRTALRAGVWLRSLARADGWPSIPGLAPGDNERTRGHFALMGALVAVLGVFGFMHGSSVYRENIESAFFYQSYFVPAVNLACSGRFTHFEPGEEATQFLNSRTGALEDCSAVAEADATEHWIPFYNQSTYLMWLMALIWKLTSVSWESLHILAGVVTAFAVISTFIFLRAFAPSSALAALGAIVFLQLPAFDNHLPHLRDFAKAPFILLPLGLIAIAMTRDLGWRGSALLYMMAGAVVGLGSGFRPDSAVIIPLALVSLFLLLLRVRMKEAAKLAGMCSLGFFAGYFLLSLPLAISAAIKPEVGSLSSHFFVLGFAETFFDDDLKMLSPHYAALRFYHDSFVLYSVSSYAGAPEVLQLNSPEYTQAAWQYFVELVAYFPHDVFLRSFYAVPIFISFFPDWISGPAIWLTGILVIGIFATPRLIAILLLSFMTLTAIATLQFSERHYFYLLTFGPAWALCGLTALIVIAVKGHTLLRAGPHRTAQIAITTAVVGLAITFFALDGLLAKFQAHQLERFAQSSLDLDWQELPFVVRGSEIAPDLERIPHNIALGRVDLREPQAGELSFSPEDFNPVFDNQVSSVASEPNLVRLTMGEQAGYQYMVGPLEIGVSPVSGLDVELFLDIEVRGEPISVGLLHAHDGRQAWITSTGNLAPGRHRTQLFATLPTSGETSLIVEKSSENSAEILVRNMLVVDRGEFCLPSPAAVQLNYSSFGSDHYSSSEQLSGESRHTYIMPLLSFEDIAFRSATIEGKSACIESVAWAPLPPGHIAAELMFTDGSVSPPLRRGSVADAIGKMFAAER